MTAVEYLVSQYEQKFGKASSTMMKDEILEALLMEGREMVRYANQLELVKAYDPIDPDTTVRHHIIEAYDAGYEDSECNSIKDAEQYYSNKYKKV